MDKGKKFGRNYLLLIQKQNGDILRVVPPFTVEFDITRNTMTSANVGSIRVYNLNENNRTQIRKNINDFWDLRQIQFYAGYGPNLSLCFQGTITQAWSVREGTNFITQLESFDGGFAFSNSISNFTFPANTPMQTVIEALVHDLTGAQVQPGVVGTIGGTLSRGNSYNGSTCELLSDLVGNQFFIDNGKAFVLADHECVRGPISLINAASGLLNTPIREQTLIHFDMLFEPRLTMGQVVSLESITTDDADNVNGTYKVVSLKHRGMISEAVCGEAITTVQLLQPFRSQALQTVGVA